MTKVTLDMGTFKALASDTRLDILKALDGKKMNLKELTKVTNLNKATLHEHLTKLNEAGLVKKKEREGHKWVYYKLTWKGEGLLHPENTRIVVLFTMTFIALSAGILQLITYLKTRTHGVKESLQNLYWTNKGGIEDEMRNISNQNDSKVIDPDMINETVSEDIDIVLGDGGAFSINGNDIIYQNQTLLYIAIACFIIFAVVLCISIWRYKKNKTPKL
jgi:DNA-binding transcriptional ArsR family regulator